MGSRRTGLRLFHRLFEGQASGNFERHFGGVHRVIAAVIKNYLEVDDGIACEISPGGRFNNSLFNGRYEIARNRAAENFIGKLKLPAARQWFHLDPAVSKLPMAARLLLVPALNIRFPADGFPIRHFGSL